MVPHYRSYEKVAVRSHPLPRRGNGNGTTYGPPAIRHESIALEESFLKQWAQVLHQFGAVLALNKINHASSGIPLQNHTGSDNLERSDGICKNEIPGNHSHDGREIQKDGTDAGTDILDANVPKDIGGNPAEKGDIKIGKKGNRRQGRKDKGV